MSNVIEKALTDQIAMLLPHILRLTEVRDRYHKDTLDWIYSNITLIYYKEALNMLLALKEGKTVQPS